MDTNERTCELANARHAHKSMRLEYKMERGVRTDVVV